VLTRPAITCRAPANSSSACSDSRPVAPLVAGGSPGEELERAMRNAVTAGLARAGYSTRNFRPASWSGRLARHRWLPESRLRATPLSGRGSC
jgi:hypothetical protein